MNALNEYEMIEVAGGLVSEEGAAMAKEGVDALAVSGMPTSGGWLVAMAKIVVGDVMFYGGWAYEAIFG